MDWVLDKVVDQSDCGASIGNTKITDLVFADDAVIFAESLEVLVMALEALHEEAKPLGLEVSWLKTKVQVFGDLLDEAVQLSVLVLIVENELTPSDTRPHTHTTALPNTTLKEYCWMREEVKELEECQPCTAFETTSSNPSVCVSAKYRQKIHCSKTGEVYRKCDRVMWLEERHFWTFEAMMAMVGMVAGFATMARQKILDHRIVQRIQRQVAAGV
ncbi:Protein JTB [Chionoecetes opilio]|uniref:Protein JTB n=1 Tax=Chionoecetes opilio TaxID=41210 RepID=A0A8J4YYR3_CHIOP|nr:Protein JTB [Chionoecetes opilio]